MKKEFLWGLICAIAGLLNLPFMLNGSIINLIAFTICETLAIIIFVNIK